MSCDCPNLIKLNKIHTFFKTDFKSDYAFDGERHDWWEMVFVINGKVGITADSSVYTIERGQMVIHRPNEFHKIRSESSTVPTVIVLSFSADVFPDFKGRVFNLDLSQIEEIQRLYEYSQLCFERMNIYVTPRKQDDDMRLQKLWLRLEFLIFSVIAQADLGAVPLAKGLKSAELYSASVKFMEQNVSSGLCAEDIASNFSISVAYLKKIFVKYSGCGVMQYYNRLRARIASTYLDQGKSVKETADLLGFGDQNYFSTFFKRTVGMSPSQFKKHE